MLRCIVWPQSAAAKFFGRDEGRAIARAVVVLQRLSTRPDATSTGAVRGYVTVGGAPVSDAHDSAESRLDRLRDILRSYGSVCVGYSGGVDSVFLAAVVACPLMMFLMMRGMRRGDRPAERSDEDMP